MTRDLPLCSEKAEDAHNYWLSKFLPDCESAQLTPDFPTSKSYLSDALNFSFNQHLTEKLFQLNKNQDISLYLFLLAVFKILLYRFTNRNYVTICSPGYLRENQFSNKLFPVIDFLDSNQTFNDVLVKITQTVIEGSKYRDYPIREDLEAKGWDESVFSSYIMLLENIHPLELVNDQVCDIKWMFVINSGLIESRIVFNANRFRTETLERFCRSFICITEQIITNPDIKLIDIDPIPETERNLLLTEFNTGATVKLADQTIHSLFEEQVIKTPEYIAVTCGNTYITYQTLNEKSNQLARVLRKNGVGADTVVGITVRPSLEMVIGILAILKAGGAYLPLDPDLPDFRKEYILKDSDLELLLIQRGLEQGISYHHKLLFLDDESITAEDGSNLPAINNSSHLAYVIYTSGSTGKPKGVPIEHHSLWNYTHWRIESYNYNENDVTLQLISFAFDGFGSNFYSSLLSGGKFVLPEANNSRDYDYLGILFKSEQVTNMSILPSMLKALLECSPKDNFISLKFIVLAGEKADAELLELSQTLIPDVLLINEYGPTECCVAVTSKMGLTDETLSIIGQPNFNNSVYILDENSHLAPIGVPGELCVSGAGLARGYFNLPELTVEKFIANPMMTSSVETFNGTSLRMYRTGDLARWLPDGNLEFLGRIDHQVKIRGYRIETGEIETCLLKHEFIKEAIVLAKDEPGGSQYLCAYLVPAQELTVTGLREYLAKQLPDYMIPSSFVYLEKLPLTPNGKVDRKALLEIEGQVRTGSQYLAPQTETQKKLALLWEEVLGLKQIGIRDNFFELGGHSLRANTLISRIHKEFNVKIPLREIFLRPTIQELADYINGSEASYYSAIEVAALREEYPLSSAQKRLFFLNRLEGGISYNIPWVMSIEGNLDQDRLEEVFRKLIDRHETLRTSFELKDGEPIQRIHPIVDFQIEFWGADSNPRVQSFIRAFDLSQAPLFRVGLIKQAENRYLLMLELHHIIADGVSSGILTREIAALYEGKDLPALKLQYRDFSEWHNWFLKSDAVKKQEEYWLNVFSGEIPVLEMPTDFARPSVRSFEGQSISFAANQELTMKMNRLAAETGTTLFMVLLATYNIVLSKYTAQEDIIIGSPIAGRPHADLVDIVGMFVNTLALRNYPVGNRSFIEFLTEVKENALKAYENQDYQFEELIVRLGIKRDLSRNPLFDTVFVLQNVDVGEIKISGLKLENYELESIISKFDFTLSAVETAGQIKFGLEYCRRLFKKETMERFAGHYLKIIEEVVSNPLVQLAEIEILSNEEKRRILFDFNDTKVDYPKDKTIPELFEEQVAKTPDKVAVVFDNQSLTYRELNAKANQLAGVLRAKGIDSNEIIGIMIGPCLEMVIGIIGILKAGCCYLPMDIESPKERVWYMIQDSDIRILLTQGNPSQCNIPGLTIMDLTNPVLYRGEDHNPKEISRGMDLAYIIYTSGSTGRPKGVMINHHSLQNLCNWHINYYQVNENDRSIKYARFGFDASVWEIFPYLIVGASLYIINETMKLDLKQLDEYLGRNKITICFLPTPICEQFMEHGGGYLRKLLTGGDRLRKYIPRDYELVNNYGPTENTVVTTSFLVRESAENIPIGKPICNTKVYIIDKHKKLQPLGVAGELCIAGVGLARGYLNNPELTDEKFITNPFDNEGRLYQTGDLARWAADGNIEFLRRMDHQVKIRGNRIETGEIENQLLKYHGLLLLLAPYPIPGAPA
ncbi:MAG TPA: amino acid adenylation domain-containing protein [Bacillota bacterium]|nr:amino acid adenylation domain-containing protein [Bacillota bacterium]